MTHPPHGYQYKEIAVSEQAVRLALESQPDFAWTLGELCLKARRPTTAVRKALTALIAAGAAFEARAFMYRPDVHGSQKVWLFRSSSAAASLESAPKNSVASGGNKTGFKTEYGSLGLSASERLLVSDWDARIRALQAENERLRNVVDCLAAGTGPSVTSYLEIY